MTNIRKFFDWVKRLFGFKPKDEGIASEVQEDVDAYEDIDEINFTAIFANKLTNLVIAESTVDVTGVNDEPNKRSEFIKAGVSDVWESIRKITAQAFGKGSMIIIPYIDGDKPRFAMVDKSRVAIDQTSGNKPTSAVILSDVAEVDDKKYERYTYYGVKNGSHKIINRAIREDGTSVPLGIVPQWANIAEEITIQNVDRPLFVHIKCPVDNRTTKDVYGVPITHGSEAIIDETKDHIKVIKREYKLTRPMLGLDSSLWKNKKSNAALADGTLIPYGRTIDDVKRTTQDEDTPFIPVDMMDGTAPWLLFAPPIRNVAMHDRLQELYSRLEKSVGTSRGILTERESASATATEIKAAQYDTFCIVSAMRKELDNAMDDLAYCYDVLAESFGLTPAGARNTYTVKTVWDMSLYESSQETFQQLTELESLGGYGVVELRQWVTGETEEQAQAAIDKIPPKPAMTFGV